MQTEKINYQQLDDIVLIKLGLNDDMRAIEKLFMRYEKKVAAAAYRLCGNRQEGEELAQETFIKAWKSLASFKAKASFGAWLVAILRNLWLDSLRKHQVPQESLDAGIETDEGVLQKQAPDESPGPDVLSEQKEEKAVLATMLGRLKPEFKEAIVLRDVQGFSYEEIADITHSNIGTVKSRLNRARAVMKEQILKYQEQNPDYFRLTTKKAPAAKPADNVRRRRK